MRSSRPAFRTALRVGFALLGLALLFAVIHGVGFEAMTPHLAAAGPWLPVVAGLELLRVGCDAVASWFAAGAERRRVPAVPLYLAHLVGYAVMAVMPAGRGVAEATKASLLAPWLGAGRSAAMATTSQAAVLFAAGLFSIPCALAAHRIGSPTLAMACWGHTGITLGAATALRVLQRHERLVGWLGRRLPWLAPALLQYSTTSRDVPLAPTLPTLAMLAGRGLQTVAYAILAASVGIEVDVPGALAVQGLNLVSAAVGVMVPGQLGASEGVFALAAEALGTTAAAAASVALLGHAVQLSLAIVGFIVLLVWRGRLPAPEPP